MWFPSQASRDAMFIVERTALSRVRTRKFLRNLGLSSGKSNKSVVYHKGLEYSPYPIISLHVRREKISSAQKQKKTSSGVIQYRKLAELQPSITFTCNLQLCVKLNLRKRAISVFLASLKVTMLPCVAQLLTEQLCG